TRLRSRSLIHHFWILCGHTKATSAYASVIKAATIVMINWAIASQSARHISLFFSACFLEHFDHVCMIALHGVHQWRFSAFVFCVNVSARPQQKSHHVRKST